MEFEEFATCYRIAEAEAQRIAEMSGFSPLENITASDAELVRLEADLGIVLPFKYRRFMQLYGGGMFSFVELLPVPPNSGPHGNLLTVNRDEGFGECFLAVAPVGTGDWWGFEVTDGICKGHVSFIYHENNKIEKSADDFLDFVAKVGLRSGM